MAKVLITEQYLQDVADAIRGLNGLTTTYTPAEMAAAITGLVTGCDATAGKILSGAKALTQNGYVTGTMANRGAWKSTVAFGSGTSKTVTVPAGYHNGSGNVKVNIGSQRYVDWTSDALAIRSASDPTKRIGQLIIGSNGSYTYYGDRYPAHYVGASGESGFSLCWMLVALPDSYLASS